MNKFTNLFFSGAITLGAGALAIFGNGAAASQAIEKNLNADIQVYSAKSNEATMVESSQLNNELPILTITDLTITMEEPQENLTLTLNEPADDTTFTVLKTLENGETVLLQYTLGEDGAKAVLTYTLEDGKSETYGYVGDEAEAVINRFTSRDVDTIPLLTYVEGQPVENDLDAEEATAIAIDEIIKKYALRPELLDRFHISPGPTFYEQYEEINIPVWWINLYPINVDEFSEIGCYSAIIDAETGEALKLLSAADGKG